MYRERISAHLPATLWQGAVAAPAGSGARAGGRSGEQSGGRRDEGLGAVGKPSAAPGGPTLTRVLPDGCMDVIWAAGDNGVAGVHGSAGDAGAAGAGDAGRLIVAGPDTVAKLTVWSPGVRYIGLRFDPGTGPARLGVAADEVRDQRIPLADLWGSGPARRLAERLAAAREPAAVLEAEFARRPAHPALVDPVAGVVLDGVRAGAAVADIAWAAGLSERQLRRRCQAVFGYGPKTLARILRLREALGRVRAGTPPAIAAADVGYADQPHLAREVRALAGVPLTELVRGGSARSDPD